MTSTIIYKDIHLSLTFSKSEIKDLVKLIESVDALTINQQRLKEDILEECKEVLNNDE